MGGETFYGKEIKVWRAVLVNETASAMHRMPVKVVSCRRTDDIAVAVDEFKVKKEVGTVTRGSLAHPEGIVIGVVGASAQFI